MSSPLTFESQLSLSFAELELKTDDSPFPTSKVTAELDDLDKIREFTNHYQPSINAVVQCLDRIEGEAEMKDTDRFVYRLKFIKALTMPTYLDIGDLSQVEISLNLLIEILVSKLEDSNDEGVTHVLCISYISFLVAKFALALEKCDTNPLFGVQLMTISSNLSDIFSEFKTKSSGKTPWKISPVLAQLSCFLSLVSISSHIINFCQSLSDLDPLSSTASLIISSTIASGLTLARSSTSTVQLIGLCEISHLFKQLDTVSKFILISKTQRFTTMRHAASILHEHVHNGLHSHISAGYALDILSGSGCLTNLLKVPDLLYDVIFACLDLLIREDGSKRKSGVFSLRLKAIQWLSAWLLAHLLIQPESDLISLLANQPIQSLSTDNFVEKVLVRDFCRADSQNLALLNVIEFAWDKYRIKTKRLLDFPDEKSDCIPVLKIKRWTGRVEARMQRQVRQGQI